MFMYQFVQCFYVLFTVLNISNVRTLLCHSYNNACENNASCDNADNVETCSNPSDPCFVLWSIDSNGTTTIKRKGCFPNYSGNDCVEQSECVDGNRNRKHGVLFCCCKAELCNDKCTLKPSSVSANDLNISTNHTNHDTKDSLEGKESSQFPFVAWYSILVIAFFLVLSLFIVLLTGKRRIKRLLQRVRNKSIPKNTFDSQSLPSTIIDIAYSVELKQQVIGYGKYGPVLKMELNEKTLVAVKKIPIKEKRIWSTEQDVFNLPLMNHDNIVLFLGSKKFEIEVWIMTEYQELGSLLDFLKNNTTTWKDTCHIAYTMTRGLMHLHDEIRSKDTRLYCKPVVAHRDFKSSNVLLKRDLTACISDFGLAKVFGSSEIHGDDFDQVGTRRYMAPEVLEGAIFFSRSSFLRIDMYAFGLVLWELVSRCSFMGPVLPHQFPYEKEVGLHPGMEVMLQVVVEKKVRPVIPPMWKHHFGMSQICDIIEECWDHDAEARLSSSCVFERISYHRKKNISPNSSFELID